MDKQFIFKDESGHGIKVTYTEKETGCYDVNVFAMQDGNEWILVNANYRHVSIVPISIRTAINHVNNLL